MRQPVLRSAQALCLTLATLTLHAEPPSPAMPNLTLLVANQKDHTLSLIDPSTSSQIAAVDVQGITGHEVAASPDGRTAFVPIYGNSGVGKPGTDGSTMQVIDLPSRKIVATVDFGHPVRPHMPIFDRNAGLLYVTTELDQTITAIDPKTLKIVGTIPTTQAESHMLALSHDGSRGYTANVGPGTVSVLDMKARKLITVIPISSTVQRISISNDDRLIFTSDQAKPELDVIDTATNTVKARVPLPGKGYGTTPTRDGRYLLICIESIKQVVALDLDTMKVVHTIDMPAAPTEVLVSPDGYTAFASCGKKVAAIDLSEWKVRSLIDAGLGADGLALAK
jgi:DNA-binding beta-propeller fold protein YncE